MERKHAIVLAMSFIIVGMMLYSVDTPLVLNQEAMSDNVSSLQEAIAMADDPVPQEPLRLNVISNPSFEDWDSVLDMPEDWHVNSSGYQFADPAYTGEVANGVYAGYVEGQGGPGASTSSYLTTGNIPPSTEDLLEPGLSLSFNWNALAVPDLQLGSKVYLRLETNGGLGYRYINYYLCTGTTLFTNDSRDVHIIGNDTINQWNSFDRNITEDFIAAFGLGLLTPTEYVSSLYFFVTSPYEATGMVRVVFDDVTLYNSTYTGFLNNGDFETGTGSPWGTTQSTLGLVEQSPISTLDSHSVNITVPQVSQGSGWASCHRLLNSKGYYYALIPGMTTIQTDWKYNDTVGAGAEQYAYLSLTFQNTSSYFVHYYFGLGDDTIHLTNETGNYYVKVPGFGVRDVWQTSEFDLCDAVSQLGFGNLPLTELSFYVYEGQSGSTVELLIDNFNILSSPANDPTFEFENTPLFDPPFLGWSRYFYAPGVVTSTPDSHSGSSACNLTAVGQEDGIYRESIYTEFDNKLATDFWWRLDHIDTSGIAGTYIQFQFSDTTQFYYIRYMLGKSATYPTSNTTSLKHVLAENINQIGTWNNLARNITDDFESCFSTSSDSWYLSGISLYVVTVPGLKLTCLFDDLQFIDTEPPVVDSVLYDATPMYYEDVTVSVGTTDARPGVSTVFVLYSINSWSSTEVIVGVYDESNRYNATIPAHVYNTQLEFYIQVADGCGNEKIDDNGGFFYTYTVGDDVAPTLTITNPTNNTDQSGLITITADVADPGSGIEYVRFNADGSGAINDYDIPYQQNWNLDDESLGSHFVIVTVRDNVGLETTKTHYFTVVDTILPVIDSPTDVEYTAGETGNVIDWDPTDLRPSSYEVFVDDVSTFTGSWNDTSEHIVIDVDGLAAGSYNYPCVVYDDAGNIAADTVIVTVNEIVTTTTTPTTSTTTPQPPPGDQTMILIITGAGVVVIFILVVLLRQKSK
ncbi:MAG: Ig-like domain-containing protein [Candidatus Thorarchaeota archaeon]